MGGRAGWSGAGGSEAPERLITNPRELGSQKTVHTRRSADAMLLCLLGIGDLRTKFSFWVLELGAFWLLTITLCGWEWDNGSIRAFREINFGF